MAIIKGGILGGFSGKVGGIVGSSWKGISILKSRPQSVSDPKTASQLAQRGKFGFVVAFAGAILACIIKPLWDRFASQMSGYNAFVKANINLFAAAMPSDFSALVIATGKMAVTAIVSAIHTTGGTDVTLTWVDDTGEGFKLTGDIAYVVVVNATTEDVQGFETIVTRAAETVTVNVSTAFEAADNVHAYLAFKRADGTVVSNSAYLLSVTH